MPELICPDWPAPGNVRAFTTTRMGDVATTRKWVDSHIPVQAVWLNQVHGKQLAHLDGPFDVGRGSDASLSSGTSKACAIMTADCLPVIFCDRAGTRVAAAHAGWRGLASGVLQATVAAMDCEPAEILAWMGPAIGPAAFEVGKDVYDIFCSADADNAVAFKDHNDRWLADIYTLARQALARVGVDQVWGGEYCTFTDESRFYSYRRAGDTGRMATVVWMAE